MTSIQSFIINFSKEFPLLGQDLGYNGIVAVLAPSRHAIMQAFANQIHPRSLQLNYERLYKAVPKTMPYGVVAPICDRVHFVSIVYLGLRCGLRCKHWRCTAGCRVVLMRSSNVVSDSVFSELIWYVDPSSFAPISSWAKLNLLVESCPIKYWVCTYTLQAVILTSKAEIVHQSNLKKM